MLIQSNALWLWYIPFQYSTAVMSMQSTLARVTFFKLTTAIHQCYISCDIVTMVSSCDNMLICRDNYTASACLHCSKMAAVTKLNQWGWSLSFTNYLANSFLMSLICVNMALVVPVWYFTSELVNSLCQNKAQVGVTLVFSCGATFFCSTDTAGNCKGSG